MLRTLAVILSLANCCRSSPQSQSQPNPLGSKPSLFTNSPLGRAVLTNPSRTIPSISITLRNRQITSSSRDLNRFELAHSLSCAPRDIRVVDPKYAGRSNSAFLPRQNGVIVHIGHVRAVIKPNEVVIFLSDTAHYNYANNEEESMALKELIPSLIQHLETVYNTPSYNSSIEEVPIPAPIPAKNYFWSSYKNYYKNMNNKNAPIINKPGSKVKTNTFPLVVIEGLLGHVCEYNTKRANQMITTVTNILGGIGSQHPKREGFLDTQSKLSQLLPMKNTVDKMESECQDLHCAINDVLKNDDDLNLLAHICDNHAKNHEEVELLFEDYLLQIDEVLTAVRDCTREVKNSEEIMEIELDLLRNRILRFEVLLEITALVVACGAAITGLFGMNLVSNYEEHRFMFYWVSGFIVALMGGVGVGMFRQCKKDLII